MKRLCIEEIQLRRKTFFPFFFRIHDALVAPFPIVCNRKIENVNMNFFSFDFLYATLCFEYTRRNKIIKKKNFFLDFFKIEIKFVFD